MNNREYIGKRVAEIRQAKGLSIRKLAELCGVTASNITKIEHGRYNVSIDILGKICEALGCRLDLVKWVSVPIKKDIRVDKKIDDVLNCKDFKNKEELIDHLIDGFIKIAEDSDET